MRSKSQSMYNIKENDITIAKRLVYEKVCILKNIKENDITIAFKMTLPWLNT